jgi:hypothetical protein
MKFWKLTGAGVEKKGDEETVTNSFPHPINPDRKIHVLQDPPHAFKCVRDQLYNHEIVQVRKLNIFSSIVLHFVSMNSVKGN